MLLDGSAEGRLLPHLVDRLGDPGLDRVDMAVSFVMKSRLARILEPFYEETWQEWSDSGDESLWDVTVGDGIG